MKQNVYDTNIFTRNLLSTVFAALVLGCAVAGSVQLKTGPWRYGNLEFESLRERVPDSNERQLIEQIRDNFAKNPFVIKNPTMPEQLEVTFDEIALEKAYINASTSNKIYVFEIIGVSDILAVYELDRKNQVLTNYLISTWDE